MMHRKTLFTVAGGSGGHILPALQLTRQWLKNNPDGKIIFFSGNSKLEKKILGKHNVPYRVIHFKPVKFSSRRWWTIPWTCVRLVLIMTRGIFYSIKYKPEKVISTGGLLSVPTCIAARLARRRVEVYELNAIPGKAVKFLLPFAHTLHTVFPQTIKHCKLGKTNFSHKCQNTQYPIRFEEKDRQLDKNDIINRINTFLQQQKSLLFFDNSRKTIFVIGGSQGSSFLNKSIKKCFEKNPGLSGTTQIIHQTGAFQEVEYSRWYANHNIPSLTFSYTQNINEYYVLADLVICRAGAGTIFEVSFFEKPCVLIPLETETTTHQKDNAQAIVTQNSTLFSVITQSQITQNFEVFSQKIQTLLSI